jgi:hypothetical protein
LTLPIPIPVSKSSARCWPTINADQARDEGLSRHVQDLGIGRISGVSLRGADGGDFAGGNADAHVLLRSRAGAVDEAHMIEHQHWRILFHEGGWFLLG